MHETERAFTYLLLTYVSLLAYDNITLKT